ncbi:hypothetical protein, partial [uncultured Bifidobacterium sp.]|uniref:hypothetical protein n=1 Tax=uncultured Bifidobacterium sp. TaxID=165187 RepID=UPI0025DEC1B8
MNSTDADFPLAVAIMSQVLLKELGEGACLMGLSIGTARMMLECALSVTGAAGLDMAASTTATGFMTRLYPVSYTHLTLPTTSRV